MKRPLLIPIIAFLFGIFIAGTQGAALSPEAIKPFASALVLIFLIAAFILKRYRSFRIAITLFFFLLGAFRYSSSVSQTPGDIGSYLADEPVKAFVYGTVISPPESGTSAYYDHLTFFLKTNRILIEDKERHTFGNIIVTIFDPGPETPQIGDNIVMSGKLSPLRAVMNPAQTDYSGQARRTGTKARLSSSRSDMILFAEPAKSPVIKLRRALDRARHRAYSVIGKYLPPGPGALTASVTLGIRSGIDRQAKDVFARTGTMHILAVSGLHIGIVAFVIIGALKLIKCPKGLLCILTVAGVFAFAVFTGCRPSSMRAAIMSAFLLGAYYLGRKSDVLNALALSALVITFFEPGQFFSPGFVLSYLAVLSIVGVTPLTDAFYGLAAPGPKRGDNNSGPRIRSSFARMVLKPVSVSTAVWVGMMPVIVSYFRIVAPSVIIANLIAVPALFALIIMGAGLVIAGSVPLLGLASTGIAALTSLLSGVLMALLGALSRVPGSYIRVPSPGALLTVLFYAALILALYLFRKRGSGRLYFTLLLLFAANFLVWIEVSRMPPDSTTFTFFSTGRSDASLVEFTDRSVMLIDGGTSGQGKGPDIGKTVIEPYLIQQGIRKIDCVVITHPHEDHVGGLLSVIESFRTGAIIDTGGPLGHGTGSLIYRDIERMAERRNISRLAAKKGDSIKGLPAEEISVLNPPESGYYGDLNEDSMVIKLVTKESSSVLFCGDALSGAMEGMLVFGAHLASDIMKAPHHGSGLGDRAVINEFMSMVRPRYIVIPNTGTSAVDRSFLAAARSAGSRVFVTGETGAVIFSGRTPQTTIDVQ
jgi:competence protein ComEC